MSKSQERMLEQGKARVVAKLTGDQGIQHIETDLPTIENEELRPLQDVVGSIREKMSAINSRKRQILQELLYLHNNWYEYTKDNQLAPYRGDAGLYKFLADKVEQKSATSYADVRIVRMLAHYQKAHLLTIEGKVNSLKRIAYINDHRNPQRAEQLRKDLLEKLPVMTNSEVDMAVEQFNNQKGLTKQISRKLRRPWAMALNEERGKITIKEMEPDTAQTLAKLLRYLNRDRLDALVAQFETEDKELAQPKLI